MVIFSLARCREMARAYRIITVIEDAVIMVNTACPVLHIPTETMRLKKQSLGHSGFGWEARSVEGFTLVEVLTAVALLALFSSGALWTLTQANRYAALSRLYTGAQLAAQSQIDLIMSKGPFNPQNLADDGSAAPQIPAELALGTHAPETVTIYSEPNGQTVTATRVTTVATDNPAKVVSGRTLNIYYATVTVTFVYPPSPAGVTPPVSAQHSVQLNAMRASDAEGG